MKSMADILLNLQYDLVIKGIYTDLELVVNPEAFERISFEAKQSLPLTAHHLMDYQLILITSHGKITIKSKEIK